MTKRTRRIGITWLAMAALLAPLLHAENADAQRRRRRGRHPTTSHPTRGGGGSTGNAGGGGDDGGDAADSGSSSSSSAASSNSGSSGGSSGSGSAASGSGDSAGSGGSSGGDGAAAPPPPPPPPPGQGERPVALDVALGGRVFGRFLGYNDDIFQAMRPYQLTAGPMIGAALEWYPGAHFSAGPASWFGLQGSFDYAVGISSQRPSDGAVFNTNAYRLAVGARFRVPFGIGSDVGVGVGYARQGFSITPQMPMGMPSANNPGIPSAEYGSIRLYASSRLQLHDRFAILLGIGTMFVVTTGEIGGSAYFRRATVTTLEANLGFAVRLVAGLELRVNADMQRYGWDINPEPGDPYIVGGAYDQWYSVALMAAYRF